jgi:hypothetical protein
MKKIKFMIKIFACLIFSYQVYAEENHFSFLYNFNDDIKYTQLLGRPTTTEIIGSYDLYFNIRRNKDISYLPPSYGVFSGSIDTEISNTYIIKDVESNVSIDFIKEEFLTSTSILN